MNKFLITFQTKTPEESSSVVGGIKDSGKEWARINNWTYCIKSSLGKAADVRESILSCIKFDTRKNLKLYVVDVTESSWATYGLPSEITTWIRT